MIERILRNWTLTRALYLGLGIVTIIQSVKSHQWVGLAFGGYFASMGLFAFGCAGGNCVGESCESTPQAQDSEFNQMVHVEEVN